MDPKKGRRPKPSEEMFLQAFKDIPKQTTDTVLMQRDLDILIKFISNPFGVMWSRIKAMKRLRSLIDSGVSETKYFHSTTLEQLEKPLLKNICDLNNQLVHETCISVAFIASKLKKKSSPLIDAVFPSLVMLLANRTKSASAMAALQIIIKSLQEPTFMTTFEEWLLDTESIAIRRSICELMTIIMETWSPPVIQRDMDKFVDVLRLGICDPDPEANQHSRRAFQAFKRNFRDEAGKLYDSLDAKTRRVLDEPFQATKKHPRKRQVRELTDDEEEDTEDKRGGPLIKRKYVFCDVCGKKWNSKKALNFHKINSKCGKM